MKNILLKKSVSRSVVVCGICFFFICLSITPSISSISKDYYSVTTLVDDSERTNEGDIPTWYQGDEWTYTVDPLYYSGPNGSFSGSIENFKQKVVGITDDMYEIEITGDISGDLTMSGFSGPLTGDITGTSYVRISDLAEETTELHSQGTITVVIVPFPYEMNLVTSSSPPLEVYDFPFNIGEQWQLVSLNTMSGSFTVTGLYEQSLNGSQWIDETVQCTQKEQITVPAGTFECYEIGRSDTQGWYSIDVGNVVKSTIDQSDENMSLQIVITLQSFSHVAQLITISEEITPAMVIPGASVVISGQASITGSGQPVQNGVVTIEIPSTGDSWSTTTDSSGLYSKTIVAPTMSDDTPSGRETGSGGVVVQCSNGGLSGYRVQTLVTMQDTPPSTPSIQGQTQGKPGVAYSYTVVAQDSEDDEVFYYVDWGDTTNSSWVGSYPSDENVSLSHTFTEKGNYIIKAKAKDVFHAESAWATLEVSMPTSTSFRPFQQFLERFPHGFPILRYLLNCVN